MGNTINKNHIWALLIIVILIFAGTNSGRFTIGSVSLVDTLSGSMLVSTGATYTASTHSPGGYYFGSDGVYIDDDGYDLRYATTGNGDHLFNDNVTIDSIFSTRSAVKIAVTGDDQLLLIVSSLHIIDADAVDPATRTLVLADGVTIGQRLRIIYQLTGANQCEIENAGNVLTKDGATRTFDVDRENMGFTWDGTYWIEDGRSL